MDDKTYRELFENSSSSDESSPTKSSPAKLTRPVRDSIIAPWQATFSQLQMHERSYRGIFENSPLPDCWTVGTEPVQRSVNHGNRPWQYTFTKLQMDENKYTLLFEKCRLPDCITKSPVKSELASFLNPEVEKCSVPETDSQVQTDKNPHTEIIDKVAISPFGSSKRPIHDISDRSLRAANFTKIQLNETTYSQIIERSSSEDSIPTTEPELEQKIIMEDLSTTKKNGIVQECIDKSFGLEQDKCAKTSNDDLSLMEDYSSNIRDTSLAHGYTIDFSSIQGFTDIDNNNHLQSNLTKSFGFMPDINGHLRNSLGVVYPVRDRLIGGSDRQYKSSCTESSKQQSDESSSMQAAISLVTQALNTSDSYDGMTPERLNTWKRIADRHTPDRGIFRYPRRPRARRLPITPYVRTSNEQSENGHDENSSPN